MKKILLACSAGMSTSLLEKKMNEYIKANNLDLSVEAKDSGSAKEMLDKYDVVLLGPQVRFMLAEFKSKATTPVEVIPMQDYGMVNGENVVKLAQKLIK